MKILKPLRIIGTGKFLPGDPVPSSVVESMHSITTGYSARYSGVLSRHYVGDDWVASMAKEAVLEAIDNAGISLDDIDLLISASASFDYILPNQASCILLELSKYYSNDIPGIDMNTTCLSFVSALDVCSSLLDGKRFKRIVIVSSEVSSRNLNPDNWETITLLGDGAAAAVVEYDSSGERGLIKADMKTYPEGHSHSIIKGGGFRYHHKNYPFDVTTHSFFMAGKKLLKMAKRKIPDFMSGFFQDLPIDITDVDVLIPHQASLVGITLFERMFDFKKTLVYKNLESHGNCVSASIPMCLNDALKDGSLKKGHTCLLCGTSAGFSIGAVLIQF